ncbi:MAG: DUF5615 family PIN-like protein [Candidatus Binatia bacterium]
MKLVFDQNLSLRLPRILGDIYPESVHVRVINLRDATDTQIWEYAKTQDFVIAIATSTKPGAKFWDRTSQPARWCRWWHWRGPSCCAEVNAIAVIS